MLLTRRVIPLAAILILTIGALAALGTWLGQQIGTPVIGAAAVVPPNTSPRLLVIDIARGLTLDFTRTFRDQLPNEVTIAADGTATIRYQITEYRPEDNVNYAINYFALHDLRSGRQLREPSSQVIGFPLAGLPAFSPDGKYVVYLTGPSGVMVLAATNGDFRQVLGTPMVAPVSVRPNVVVSSADDPGLPIATWSPDSRQLAYNADGNLYIYDIASGQSRQITNDDAIHAAPVWSPDGTRLVWLRVGAEAPGTAIHRTLYTLNGDGEADALAADPDLNYGIPVWSPDSARLALPIYAFPQGTPLPQIVIVDAVTGDVITMPLEEAFFTPNTALMLQWSADGAHLLARARRGSVADSSANLFLLTPATGAVRALTDAGYAAVLSPDGESLVFQVRGRMAGVSGDHLLRADLRTNAEPELIHPGANSLNAVYLPDGRLLYIHRTGTQSGGGVSRVAFGDGALVSPEGYYITGFAPVPR